MHNRIQKYILFVLCVGTDGWATRELYLQPSILSFDNQMHDVIISRRPCPCTDCMKQAYFDTHNHTGSSEIRSTDFYQESCQCTDCVRCTNQANQTEHTTTRTTVPATKKPWTVLVFMAADNGLRRFAIRNIQEMAKVGSNANFNLLVHLDILKGTEKISEFYYIEKNRVTQIDVYPSAILPMDSGNPQTLSEFCKHGLGGFPADHYALILWNHGTGTLNPRNGRFINPSLLFSFNPLTNKLDLDRSVPYLDLVSEGLEPVRGVCWDDTTGNYLSNELLATTLKTICTRYLQGKKFDIIGFDACLMQMIEVCAMLKECGDVVIGSQEVELGTGWNYSLILIKFASLAPTVEEFSRHVVASYHHAYQNITNDYTLSAIRLAQITTLEKHVDRVASLLHSALLKPELSSLVSTLITKSRDPRSCTHFDEPSYIDLYNFYDNLEKNLDSSEWLSFREFYIDIKEALSNRKTVFKDLIVAHTSGKNLSNSHGISIYFPFSRIHASYQTNDFFKTNTWGSFLMKYVYA